MKLAILALAAPAVMLAAPADAKPKTYRALGTEPFWSLEIGAGSIVYTPAQGRRIITATPVARPSFNGRRYVTAWITIDITRAPCNDGMSDRSYPEQVRVTIGRTTLSGCGGVPQVDSAFLEHGRWTITSIDSRPVRTPRPTAIGFANGQLSGSAGCNRINGGYTLRGTTLETRNLVSTRMACIGPGMLVERRFLSIVSSPATLSMAGDDTITLTSRSGTATLRRIAD